MKELFRERDLTRDERGTPTWTWDHGPARRAQGT